MEKFINKDTEEDSEKDLKNGSQSAGRWTKEEHQKFVEALKVYGKNWKKVEEHVATRTGAQIRSHAQKFFNRIQKELHVDKGEAIENILNFDKTSNEAEEDNSIKKRSFNEFITTHTQNYEEKYQDKHSSSKKLSIDINDPSPQKVEDKLKRQYDQIDNSIINIKESKDIAAKDQKLGVWKYVISSIIGLTKQFVEELNTTKDIAYMAKISHYNSFLNNLRTQLVDLYSNENGLGPWGYGLSGTKGMMKALEQNFGFENNITLKRPHSLSEDHILLHKQELKLSDIVQQNSSQLPLESIKKELLNSDINPSFKVHEMSQEMQHKYEKFKNESTILNFETNRKRFMSFNLF